MQITQIHSIQFNIQLLIVQSKNIKTKKQKNKRQTNLLIFFKFLELATFQT